MKPTTVIGLLDDTHSVLVEAAVDNEAAVLRTIASVLSSVSALDKSHNDPDYWRTLLFNLNTLADDIEHEQLGPDEPTLDPDWDDELQEDE